MTFSFSYCGFANPVLFSEINEGDIKQVETFVRNDLMEILSTDIEQSTAADEVVIDEEKMKENFGVLFALNPTKFKFLPGDRKCIQLIKDLIQRHIKKHGRKKAMNYFTDESEDTQPTCKRLKTESENHDESASLVELEENLYTCIMQKLAKLGVSKSILNNFAKSMVRTGRDVDGKIYGEVFCILCRVNSENIESAKKNDLKPKKMYLRTKNEKQSWVLSNFNTHLETHKDMLNQTENESVESIHIEILSPGDINYQTLQENKSLADFSTASMEDICNSCDTGDARMERMFNKQFSAQNIFIWQQAMLNSETFENVDCFSKDESVYTLQIVQMLSDGNCLFSAASHQLFGEEVNSAKHIESTNKLRADVVQYIEDHFDTFLHELRGHLYELQDIDSGETYKRYGLSEFDDIDEACKHFLTNVLNKSGVWGGGETLKAIACIHNVNILVFNENGPVYIVGNAHGKDDRTIALAYCLGLNGSRNHYASVCNITGIDIYNIAKEVTENLNQNQHLKYDLNTTL